MQGTGEKIPKTKTKGWKGTNPKMVKKNKMRKKIHRLKARERARNSDTEKDTTQRETKRNRGQGGNNDNEDSKKTDK